VTQTGSHARRLLNSPLKVDYQGMSPTAEQLVRDYLNGLSIAARDCLKPRDRHALLVRVRTRIEAEVGGVATASAVLVQSVLAELGDPAALIEAERARRSNAQVPDAGSPVAGSDPAEAGDVQPLPHRIKKVVTARPNAIPALSALPVGPKLSAAASEPGRDGQNGATAPDGSQRPAAIVPPQGASPEQAKRPAGRWLSRAPRAPGSPGAPGSPAVPGSSGSAPVPGSSGSAPALGPPAGGRAGGQRQDIGSGQEAAAPAQAGPQFEVASGSDRLAETATSVLETIGRRVTALGAAVRKHKIEAVAIVLLGVGGAIYPPVWLLGAVVALLSRVFDGRDKWLGVGLPVLLVALSAVLEVIFGGHRDSVTAYTYEAWLAAGRVSRAAAALGACYLVWPLHRGKRGPRHPPWYRPPKPRAPG
jgi:hypothetical protein